MNTQAFLQPRIRTTDLVVFSLGRCVSFVVSCGGFGQTFRGRLRIGDRRGGNRRQRRLVRFSLGRFGREIFGPLSQILAEDESGRKVVGAFGQILAENEISSFGGSRREALARFGLSFRSGFYRRGGRSRRRNRSRSRRRRRYWGWGRLESDPLGGGPRVVFAFLWRPFDRTKSSPEIQLYSRVKA